MIAPRATLLALFLQACTCGRDQPAAAPPLAAVADAAARRIPSAPGTVHAYPPHAIRRDGVGPYVLGEQMSQVLRELPEGPHLELVQVGKYANWRVARAEDGAIIIGADASNEVVFVSVLKADVARTATGVAVGAPVADLFAALGPARGAAGVIRDRRVLDYPSLPGVRFLTDARVDARENEGHVVGVVVTGAERPAADLDAGAGCPDVVASDEELVLAARLKQPREPPMIRAACVSGAGGEALVFGEGEVALVGGEPGKLKRLATAGVGPVDFAGALDVDGDHHDEVVYGAQRRSPHEHVLEVHALRWEAGKLIDVLAERPFSITEGVAAMAAVTPEQIDLVVELRADHGALVAGGYYTVHRDGALRELAPLSPVTLKLEARRPAGAAAAAAAADAASETDDGG